MRRLITIIALGTAVFAALPAFAQNMTPRPPVAKPVADPQLKAEKPCECRARGEVFVTGDQTCLNGMIAVCDMEQNVTTWRMTRQSCPSS